tara:strand:- start:91 stop:378 length:288 start_codon:yes stop_codon:yes gene_type:complete
MSKKNTAATATNNNDAILSRLAELEAQQAELKALREQAKNMVRLGITKNGHLAIYGVRKFPITFKTEELPKVSEMFTSGKVAEFVAANASKLTRA